jgi:hypothetical protein
MGFHKGDRVEATVDGEKITGTVKGGEPPQNVSHPERTVHVHLDRAKGMFISRWLDPQDVQPMP